MRESKLIHSRRDGRTSIAFPLIAVLISTAMLWPSTINAQLPIVYETQRIAVQTPSLFQAFGHAVAAIGDVAVVTDPFEDNIAPFAGSAYVYRYDGAEWVEEQRLVASDSYNNIQFGWAGAIDDDLIAIGATTAGIDATSTRTGAVYVFRHDGASWVEEQKLLASDGGLGGAFGCALSLRGNLMVIGSCGDDDNGVGSGSAYVFQYDGRRWTEMQKLLPSDGSARASFGLSVSIADGGIAIGSLDHESRFDAGAVYIFRDIGVRWAEDQKLTASDGGRQKLFGASLAASGDWLLVGSYGAHAAYLYRYDGTRWHEVQKIVASDRAFLFGWSVALLGHLAVIGAPGDDDDGSYSGSAYVFRYSGTRWREEQKLLPSDGSEFQEFGLSAALSSRTTVVGAPGTTFQQNPSAYSYALDLRALATVDIKPGSDRNPIDISGRGSIPVAILGSGGLDVREIDVTTLAFGAPEISPTHDLTDPEILADHLRDVNDDGFTDLVTHYSTQQAGFSIGDSEACLSGKLLDGRAFEGCDSVWVFGNRGARRTAR